MLSSTIMHLVAPSGVDVADPVTREVGSSSTFPKGYSKF